MLTLNAARHALLSALQEPVAVVTSSSFVVFTFSFYFLEFLGEQKDADCIARIELRNN